MIAINNAVADTNGRVIIRHLDNRLAYDSSARIIRTKTLDNDGVLTHGGTAAIDGKLNIKCRVTAAEFSILKSMHENAISVVISYWAGCYLGYIFRLRETGGGATIVIYFKEKFA